MPLPWSRGRHIGLDREPAGWLSTITEATRGDCARDRRASRHFGFNEATSTLQRLQFTSGKPMAETTNLGLRLLSIPGLSTEDVELLERLQHKVEHGRNAFMSYSHRDDAIASLIESELAHRDISVSRDTLILPGQLWEDALRKEVATTDSFVVLVSPNSAAATSYVHREVTWAVREYTAGGLVSSIVHSQVATETPSPSSAASSHGTTWTRTTRADGSIGWPKGLQRQASGRTGSSRRRHDTSARSRRCCRC
jgi:hypothetical protein